MSFTRRMLSSRLLVAALLATATAAATSNTAYATPGPVAAYGFDDGSGSVLSDASGNSRSGTIVGATWTTSGKFGSALSFNGSNARVDLPALGTFYKTGFTLEVLVIEQWFHIPARAGEEVIDTKNLRTLSDQTRTKMRAEKTSSTGDQNTFFEMHSSYFAVRCH
jgi:hypothetical protein